MNRIAIMRTSAFLLLWALLVGLSGLAAAADKSRGITVSGAGEAEAMPNTLELTATVVGTAELAGDAVEKFRANKRRILESLKRLDIEGMSVVGAGLSVNSDNPINAMAALRGQANQPKVADKVAVQERLTISLSGIDTMVAKQLLQTVTRVVDTAKDAGVAVGPGTPQGMLQMQLRAGKPAALATYRLTNVEVLRQEAYASALKQARSKAERLAQLAGVQLGDILSIQEAQVAPEDDAAGGLSANFAMLGMPRSAPSDYTSTELRPIPVTVELNVQFDIVTKK